MGKLGGAVATGLLFATGAVAQTSQVQGPVSGNNVTLFGVADATIAYGTGSIATKTQLTSGGNTTSRLGFRGVEDLGGGLAAGGGSEQLQAFACALLGQQRSSSMSRRLS